MTTSRKLFLPLVVCAAAAVSPVAIAAGQITAFTRANKDRTLSFVNDGRVAEVFVEEGQAVTKGQVLARLDDTVEQLQLEQLKAEAEDNTRVKAHRAELEQKQAYLTELEERQGSGAVTKWEIKKAQLDVVIAQANFGLAELEHRNSQLKYDQAKAAIDRMRLISPIDGTVEEVRLHPGESARALADVANRTGESSRAPADTIRVVQIEPLWVKAPVPLSQATRLTLGGDALVTFTGPRGDTVTGTITHIGAVADYASYTLTVHVRLPDGLNRPAGEEVTITFPPTAEKDANEAGPDPAGSESEKPKDQ